MAEAKESRTVPKGDAAPANSDAETDIAETYHDDGSVSERAQLRKKSAGGAG